MSYEYKLLDKSSVDVEVLVELAKAHEELAVVNRRKKFLENLVREHRDLEKHLWQTNNGQVIVIQKLTDDHLKNIVKFLITSDREVPISIETEYQKRFGKNLTLNDDLKVENGEVVGEGDTRDEFEGDLPF